MNVLQLRTAKELPATVIGLSEFYVVIGGATLKKCTSLHEAKDATAYCGQTWDVLFRPTETAAKECLGPKRPQQ
jgi:hypothetical protein